jgi:hypothetical protein
MQAVDSLAIDRIGEPLSKAVRGAYEGAHLGRPLSEGTLKDRSVVCPWHGSEFALDDGRVLNGPTTHNQPCLLVRERDGRIEVRMGSHPHDGAVA